MTIWVCAESLRAAYRVAWADRLSRGADDVPRCIGVGLPEGSVAAEGHAGDAPPPALLAADTDTASLLAAGAVVASWTIAGGGAFEAVRVPLDNEDGRALMRRAESLATWFIDGADHVDLTDPRWEVVALCAHSGPPGARRVFAGYVTVFTFHNPLRKVDADRPTSLRVCQMLLLPPFQRRGSCATREWVASTVDIRARAQAWARSCLGSCMSGRRRATHTR